MNLILLYSGTANAAKQFTTDSTNGFYECTETAAFIFKRKPSIKLRVYSHVSSF